MRLLSAASILALTIGCIGEVPPQDNNNPGSPDAGGGGADAPADPLPLTGVVNDYFAGTIMADVTINGPGGMTATTDASGQFTIDDPPGMAFIIDATAAGYRATKNAAVQHDGTATPRDFYVISTTEADRQVGLSGVAPVAGTSVVVAEFLKGDGTPRDGVAIADVSLVDGADAPVGDGPFFSGALGDLDLATLVSTPANGRALVFFVNVPPGDFTLRATYPQDSDGMGGGGNQNKTADVTAVADGATLIRVNDKLDGGGGGGGGGGGN